MDTLAPWLFLGTVHCSNAGSSQGFPSIHLPLFTTAEGEITHSLNSVINSVIQCIFSSIQTGSSGCVQTNFTKETPRTSQLMPLFGYRGPSPHVCGQQTAPALLRGSLPLIPTQCGPSQCVWVQSRNSYSSPSSPFSLQLVQTVQFLCSELLPLTACCSLQLPEYFCLLGFSTGIIQALYSCFLFPVFLTRR